MRAGITFLNASLGLEHTRRAGTLRVAGARIAGLEVSACAGDLVIDMRGDRLIPGLINAHDHLQLNNLPPLPSRAQWRNAREWIAQINLRRQSDPDFEAQVAVPLEERLLIGGVKNLLSGVTTVAHHDPLYPLLCNERFPVRVVTDYGWSHSLYIDGEEQVRQSYRSTPPSWPWIIHAAEGVDAEASGEFGRLEALGCIGPNTLIVHGIALDRAQSARLENSGAGLIWCPSSNLRLFGRAADVSGLFHPDRVALGTDSRLSGSRDLLGELRTAREASGMDEATLESLVTRNAANLLRLADRGVLCSGARADLLVLPAGMPLSSANRGDVRLVMVGGRALYADPDYARLMGLDTQWVAVCVDGRPKMLAKDLAAAVSAAKVGEAGVEISDLSWRAA